MGLELNRIAQMTDLIQPNRLRFGPYEVDLHTHELWKFGTKVRLVGQPFAILAMLVTRAGSLVTRDELREKLWPGETFVDFNHGLNAAVNKLRDVLCDSAEGSEVHRDLAASWVPLRGGSGTLDEQ
jgi:DNA-binding response OmpR family regulator